MTTASHRGVCWSCRKERNTFTCRGCRKELCLSHLQEHQQQLNEQLDKVIDEHGSLRQIIIELQLGTARNSPVIKQVDEWEEKCLEIIREQAEECRKSVLKQAKAIVEELDPIVVELSAKLQQIRNESDFNEVDLERLTKQVTQMREQFNQIVNFSIRHQTQTLIGKIQAAIPVRQEKQDAKRQTWKQEARTVAGGNKQGEGMNQLSGPEGIFVDDDGNIFIADLHNHRIVRWNSEADSATIVAGGNGQGGRIDQLNCPSDVLVDKENRSIIIADQGNRRVIRWDEEEPANSEILLDNIDCWALAMDNQGYLYVSDREKHEVRRWKEGERKGTLVAGGNGLGPRLMQLNSPTYLFVDEQQSVYISDRENHRVMKWVKGAKEGVLVAGGNGKGNELNQLSHPAGITVDQRGEIYVSDAGNARIMRGRGGERNGEIVAGGNEEGRQANQLAGPKGLATDPTGNLYVADGWNARVQMFQLLLPSKFFLLN